MTEAWWVSAIDWRLSSGLIFWLILWRWRRGQPRSAYYLRMLVAAVILLGSSWLMRFVIESYLLEAPLMSLGYGLYLLILSLLYLFCYKRVYQVQASLLFYQSSLALLVYRLAWHVNKVITVGLVQLPFAWPIEKAKLLLSLAAYLIYALVIAAAYGIDQAITGGMHMIPKKASKRLLAVMLGFQVILEMSYWLVNPDEGSSVMLLFFFSSLMYSLMSFLLLLLLQYIEALRQDNRLMEGYMVSKKTYYDWASGGIHSLQRQCHDLKHQIRLMRTAKGKAEFDSHLAALQESIDRYNTVIETGNKALDVVLTEKNILCMQRTISFSYMLDGRSFAFLSDMEIYALFGNIMENAMESMTEERSHFIRMKAAQRGDYLVLHVANSFDRPLQYEGGTLVSSKQDSARHGYGLRSIEALADAYNGAMAYRVEEKTFHLSLSFLRPKEEAAPSTASQEKTSVS